MRVLLAVALAAAAIPCGAQTADPGPVCDAAAAHPDDRERPSAVPGVPIYRIEPRTAAEACRLASEREPGNARYLFQLGRALQRDGDRGAARLAYARAAALGHARASFNVAQQAYREGPERDLPLARQHYGRAAELGVREAMTQLASMLFEGEGGPEDAAASRQWLERGAEAGDSEAMALLAAMLFIEDDAARGLDWLARAIASEDGRAISGIVTAAQTIGLELPGLRARLREMSSAGDSNAMFALAVILEHGIDGPADVAEGGGLIARAAAAGQADAVLRVARSHSDRGEARRMLLRAAETGFLPAMTELGRMLVLGEGGERDVGQGREWYARAAAEGDEEAERALAALPRP